MGRLSHVLCVCLCMYGVCVRLIYPGSYLLGETVRPHTHMRTTHVAHT